MTTLVLAVLLLLAPWAGAATMSGVLFDQSTRLLSPTNLVASGFRATNLVAAPGPSSNSFAVLNSSGVVVARFDSNGDLVSSGSATFASVTGAGTVTSVAATVPADLTVTGSPVTTSGTLAITRNSQTQNKFLASPDGTSGSPTYRAIVAGDLPPFVSSVGLTVPSWLSVAGSPVTSSGSFAVTASSQSANLVLASPDGSSGAMTPRSIALGDLPSTVLRGSLTSGVIPVASGSSTLSDGYLRQSGGFVFGTNAAVVLGSQTNGLRALGVDAGDVTTTTNLPGLIVRMKNDNASGVYTNALFVIDDAQQSSLTTSRAFAIATKSRGTIFDIDEAGAIYGTSGHVTGVMTADGGFSGNSAVVSGTGQFNKVSTATIDTTSLGDRTTPALTIDSTHNNAGWYGFSGGWRFANYTGVSGSDTREVLAIGGNPGGGLEFSSVDGLSWSGNSTNINSASAVASMGVVTNGLSIGDGTVTNSNGSIHTSMGNFTNLIVASGSTVLNGVALQWPSSHGSAGYLLYDTDGAGTLGYIAPAAGGGGTVTSVAMTVPSDLSVSGSPVTVSGTLAVTRNSQTQNKFLASPDGSSGAPTYRAIVAADLPGSGAGSGTVTSVDMSVPSILSVSGNPVTSSGTLAVTLATETANTVLAGPTSGGAATPTFRALASADLPSGLVTSSTLTAGVVPVATGAGAIGDSVLVSSGQYLVPRTNANTFLGSQTNGFQNLSINAGTTTTTTNYPAVIIRARQQNASGVYTNFYLVVDDGSQSSLSTSFLMSLATVSRGPLFTVDETGNVVAPTIHTSGVGTFDGGISAGGSIFSGKIVTYNNISTAANGLVAEYAQANLTAQTAAISATTLYTPVASGAFRVDVVLHVTTAGTTSVLGGTTGVVLTYTEPDGSVAQTVTMQMSDQSGTPVVTSSGNTGNSTTTVSQGSAFIQAKTGVAIQYAVGYSSTGTAMQYSVHARVEAL